MTASMIVRHRVGDYDKWKSVYDGRGVEIREQGGVIEHSVHRDLDDPQLVTVVHQFADEQSLRSYLGMLEGEEFRALAEETKIDLDSLEVSLLADVD